MVYPALLAVVSDRAPGMQRAGALDVYRFWRDFDQAGGAMKSLAQELNDRGILGRGAAHSTNFNLIMTCKSVNRFLSLFEGVYSGWLINTYIGLLSWPIKPRSVTLIQ
jgi:hypothetical protein